MNVKISKESLYQVTNKIPKKKNNIIEGLNIKGKSSNLDFSNNKDTLELNRITESENDSLSQSNKNNNDKKNSNLA
jgi:hypothetical protein